MPLPQPQPVPGNDWRQVTPPELDEWRPELTVTVVLPAHDCQIELELTLAALARQRFPKRLLDVVVVDDGSSPPLELPSLRPARTEIVRLPGAHGHGSGRARHAGAQASSGKILLFLDADMVAHRDHVAAHARWHHVLDDAVVLGYKRFVDVQGIHPAAVARATAVDDMDGLLAGRAARRHEWQEDLIDASEGLVTAGEDAFTAVVGATVSTTRSLYSRSGGFRSFPRRGIVDTEFGYRLWTAGGVLVPEPLARSIHQGQRNFATRGDELKRERAGLAANLLPIALFRRSNAGRSWQVPMVQVLVPADDAPPEVVQVTVDAILASSLTDLAVTVSRAGEPVDRHAHELADYYVAEPRVRFLAEPVATGFPSPYTAVVPAGSVLGRGTLVALLAQLGTSGPGTIRVAGVEAEGKVELWATRALERARRHAAHLGGVEAAARALFPETWVSGPDVDITAADPRRTPQGMVYDSRVTGSGSTAGGR